MKMGRVENRVIGEIEFQMADRALPPGPRQQKKSGIERGWWSMFLPVWNSLFPLHISFTYCVCVLNRDTLLLTIYNNYL